MKRSKRGTLYSLLCTVNLYKFSLQRCTIVRNAFGNCNPKWPIRFYSWYTKENSFSRTKPVSLNWHELHCLTLKSFSVNGSTPMNLKYLDTNFNTYDCSKYLLAVCGSGCNSVS
jgi:hypothetical protein